MEHSPLIEALQLTAGAFKGLVDALQVSESERIKFTGPWARFGTLTVGEILDRANTVLSQMEA